MSRLTHLDEQGRARMVDVSAKIPTHRVASASGTLRCLAQTMAQVEAGTAPKGAVIRTAELAGIMAAKRTAELIPLCHPLPLSNVAVTIEPDRELPGFHGMAEVSSVGLTGVELEALTAVSVACLTLFDMLKAIDRTMIIDAVRVTAKSGGKSGGWSPL
jgi:cyclic pyranopterin phosphate synthase